MIRSTALELGEYDIIRHPDHISKVWGEIEKSMPKYWQKFVEAERRPNPIAELAAKFGKDVSSLAEPECDILARVFEDAVASYQKDAEKYRRFFDPDVLEEFHDDPNAFKQGLVRDVPIIANTLRQRRAELKEWQTQFRGARAKDLLEVFSNVLEFAADWYDTHPMDGYDMLDEPSAFGLNPLDDEESMQIKAVIGMGIKSIMLYHLYPERLPSRNRDGLNSLYFLSGRSHFGLPSESSEFLMVNDLSPASDGSIIMDQNYWYPYGLFSLYALRVFKWIAKRASTVGFTLDRSVRYVYVDRFFKAVCAQHQDDLHTMRALERFEIPL